MSGQLWVQFIFAWAVLTLPLGPNAVNTMVMTLANGFVRGLCVPLGIGIASLLFGMAAALGIGAIIMASPNFFFAIKAAGVGYLLYLAIAQWRSVSHLALDDSGGVMSACQLLTRGCMVSLGNPKAAFTYFSVYPQFIVYGKPIVPQLLVLLPTTFVVVVTIYIGYALIAAPLRGWLRPLRRRVIFSRIIASVYVVGAVAIATAVQT